MTSPTNSGTESSTGSRKYLVATLRLVVVIVVVVAIVATFMDTAKRATINPFNFFGFFTMQSNIIAALALFLAALATFMGRPQTRLLMFARACATTYIVIVGIVYNLLLAGPGGRRLTRVGELAGPRRLSDLRGA